MNLFTRAPRPPRASGRDPSLIHPDAWNKLVDYVVQLEAAVRQIIPRSSADILTNTSSGGTTYSLARRPKDVTPPPCGLAAVLVEGEAGWSLYVRPGYSGNLIPTMSASPVGPTNLSTITVSTSLYLKVTWTPDSDYDADLPLYWMIAGGTHVSSEFILSASPPTDTDAEIDPDTGAATDGVYHFLWATINVTGGVASFTASRCGNHQFTFCPATLTLIFDAVGAPAVF